MSIYAKNDARIKEIANDNLVSYRVASNIIESFVDYICDELTGSDYAYIKNLGTFKRNKKAGNDYRVVFNPTKDLMK